MDEWNDGKLKLDGGDGHTPLWMYLMSLNCARKNAQSKGKSSRNEMKVQKQQQKSPKKDELLW